MADALHKNAETVGSISKDLVLNTFGRIYIRVRDKYYELNYDNTGWFKKWSWYYYFRK